MHIPGSRTRLAAVALTCVVALVAMAGAATELSHGGQRPVVYAEFADASPLIVGNDVKLSGVKVGSVESIAVQDGRARVGLRLDQAALPLHRDATATIRPVSLLGERYVALDRGSPSAPALGNGGVIPPSQTGRSTDLDEVLSAIDRPTGEGLAALITTLGEGTQGQGKEVARALAVLAPAMKQTDQLARLLAQHNSLLTSLVDRVQPVASALAADDGRSMNRLVKSADAMLQATADKRAAIEASLTTLPGTLSKAQATLSRLAGVADATTPTLASLRPVTDDLSQISAEIQGFADAANPALASAKPVLERADRLLDVAAPEVRALRPAAGDLRGVARAARPLATDLINNLSNILDFVRYWALTTNGADGLSNYFRAHLVVTPETVGGPVPGGGSLGTIPPGGVPTGPGLPPVPMLSHLPALGTPAAGNVTGLTPAQESSLMNQLLGGQ